MSKVAFALALSLTLLTACAERNVKVDVPSADFDRTYLTETLNHLSTDMKIASACKGKKIRQELALFCGELLERQTRESDQMRQMLKDWYQRTPHGDPYPLWVENQDGEVFERAFLKGVLREHDDTAKRAGQCSVEAKHSELATLCRQMASHRAEEAIKMKQWSCQWFKEC